MERQKLTRRDIALLAGSCFISGASGYFVSITYSGNGATSKVGDGSSSSGRPTAEAAAVVEDIYQMQSTIDRFGRSGSEPTGQAGGLVVLAQGDHRPLPQSLPIDIPSGVAVAGVGGRGTHVRMDGIGKPLFQYTSSESQQSNILIRDIAVSGDRTDGSRLVYFDDNHNWRIERCVVWSTDIGIETVDSWNGSIVDCSINSCGNGIVHRGSANHISHRGGIVNQSTRSGVRLDNGTGHHFSGFNFEGSGRYGLEIGTALSLSPLGCYFESNGSDLYRGGSHAPCSVGVTGQALKGASITGTYIKQLNDRGTGILLGGLCEGIDITGNRFVNGYALEPERVSNVHFEANNFISMDGRIRRPLSDAPSQTGEIRGDG